MGKVIAIVPAAGLGKRFGRSRNKTFQTLAGKPLVIWPLLLLDRIKSVSEIIPVFKKSDMELGCRLIEEFKINKVTRIASGGKERQDSVYNAIKLIGDTTDIVLIHDGVRPLIEQHIIEESIRQVRGCDGVVVGIPPKDTIKEAEKGFVKKTLRRELLWQIQTPQVFKYSLLLKAYQKAESEGVYFTDDSAIVERYGGKIKIIMGSYTNIKITTPEDLLTAESFLQQGFSQA